MIMQRMSKLVLPLIIIVALCSSIAAAEPVLPTRAADNFNFQYNGDVYPVPNYTDMGGWEATPTSDGDILTCQSSVANAGGYLMSDDWGANVFDFFGWTVELRLKIADDAEEGASGVLNICANDDAFSNQWGILRLFKDSITYWAQNQSTAPVFDFDTTDAFHTYRLAQEADSNVFHCWVDGQYLCGWASTRTIGTQYLYFGDAAPTMGGPTVYYDYVNFDSTGAYAPVPEPSVAVLLSIIGGVFCLLRRR